MPQRRHRRLECKQPVIDAVLPSETDARTRPRYEEDPTLVKSIVADGCEKAQKLAEETMRDVREVMGLNHNDARITVK
jgi:tryptophanyl-tRNA synthetase